MNKYIYTTIAILFVVGLSYVQLLRRSNMDLQDELEYKEYQIQNFRDAQRSNLATINTLTQEKEDMERRWNEMSKENKDIDEEKTKLNNKVLKPTQGIKDWKDTKLPSGLI